MSWLRHEELNESLTWIKVEIRKAETFSHLSGGFLKECFPNYICLAEEGL